MGCAMDVVALAFEMCNDVVDRIEKGFIILEREAGFPFESGSNTVGQLPPQTAGDVEVRAEIKEGTVFGGTVFAIGFDEGKAVAFFTVFTFVGSVSDKHDRSVELVRGKVPGCLGGGSRPHLYSTTLSFPKKSAKKGRKTPNLAEIALLGGKNERIGDGTQRFPLTGWRS